jgi:pimeloyl-ACP methyl ester carboxylesterase
VSSSGSIGVRPQLFCISYIVSSLREMIPEALAGPAMLSNYKQPELPEWLRELYPFRTRAAKLGEFSMSFIDEGTPDAAPVLLVHGSPTWSFLFRNLLAPLRAHHRVIAPDHIGFGLSDKPAAPSYHTLRQHIGNLTTLVDALELRNVTLVAHDWGGPIALGYAVARPRNVARILLVNSWAGNLPTVTTRTPPLALRIAHRGRIGMFLDRLLNLSHNSAFSWRRPISDLVLEAYSYPFPDSASRMATRVFSHMFFSPDPETQAAQNELLAALKNIEAPAEILCGEQDPLLSKLPAYILRDNLRHASEPVFLDAAHYIPEDAADELAQRILRAEQPPADQPGSVFKILG